MTNFYDLGPSHMIAHQAKLWWAVLPIMLALPCPRAIRLGGQVATQNRIPHGQQCEASLSGLGWRGETILFLHGAGDTAHIFDDLAPKFTNQFRVLGLTRRGHGQSEKPEAGYDTATLVEDIRQFLDALKIQRVILVGHSLAGDELTRFAGEHPDRVIKLVYLDAAHDRARSVGNHEAVTSRVGPNQNRSGIAGQFSTLGEPDELSGRRRGKPICAR